MAIFNSYGYVSLPDSRNFCESAGDLLLIHLLYSYHSYLQIWGCSESEGLLSGYLNWKIWGVVQFKSEIQVWQWSIPHLYFDDFPIKASENLHLSGMFPYIFPSFSYMCLICISFPNLSYGFPSQEPAQGVVYMVLVRFFAKPVVARRQQKTPRNRGFDGKISGT